MSEITVKVSLKLIRRDIIYNRRPYSDVTKIGKRASSKKEALRWLDEAEAEGIIAFG